MIDFTNSIQKNKAYAGANGGKIAVVYNNEQYMLKFPPYPTKNKDMSYTNSCISEYIGCKIFELLKIPVQETMIGTYTSKNKTKIVVACKDFTKPGIVLQDFASLKNRIIDSERNGYGTDLNDILSTIEEQTSVDSEKLKECTYNAYSVLYEGEDNIIDRLSYVKSNIQKCVSSDSYFDSISETLENVYELLRDSSSQIKSYFDDISFDEQTFNELNERVDVLNKLKRK